MDARTILVYGHKHVLDAFAPLTDAEWGRVGVTTRWTPTDLMAHLTSFELMLGEALGQVLGEGGTPTLEAMGRDRAGFNDAQVAARRGRTPAEVQAEYEAAHAVVMERAAKLGPDRLREPGTIPWYGAEYSLDDLIVYTNYAHKREHCAQVRRFRLDAAGAASS